MGIFSKFFQKKKLPSFAQEYLQSHREINKNNSIDATRYVCFDTETSSLNTKEAKLLSIGAIVISNNKILVQTALELYISGNGNTKPHNIEIHGITNQKSSEGIALEEALKIFLDYIKGSVLIAHNAQFDIAIINQSLKNCGFHFKLNNPILDTAKLAIRLDKAPLDNSHINKSDYLLDTLLLKHNIKSLERHTALGDAYSTATLFLKLISKLKERGIKRLSEII